MRKPHNLQDTFNQGWYCPTNRLSIPMHLLLNKQHQLQPPHLSRGILPSSISPNSTILAPFCHLTNNLTHPDHVNQLNTLHQILPLQTPKCSLNYAPTSLSYHISLHTYLFQNYSCNMNRAPMSSDLWERILEANVDQEEDYTSILLPRRRFKSNLENPHFPLTKFIVITAKTTIREKSTIPWLDLELTYYANHHHIPHNFAPAPINKPLLSIIKAPNWQQGLCRLDSNNLEVTITHQIKTFCLKLTLPAHFNPNKFHSYRTRFFAPGDPEPIREPDSDDCVLTTATPSTPPNSNIILNLSQTRL